MATSTGTSPITLTEHAVRTLVRAEAKPGHNDNHGDHDRGSTHRRSSPRTNASNRALVVRLVPLSSTEAIITDGSNDRLRVLCLWNDDDCDNDSNSLNGFSEDEEFTVSIRSYISSAGNTYGSDVVGTPAVCLSDFQVLQRHPRPNKRQCPRSDDTNPRLWKQVAEGRVPGSQAPEFLAKYAKSLSNDELAGKECHPWYCTKEQQGETTTSTETKIATISDFLARHHAMQTLHQHSSFAPGPSSSENDQQPPELSSSAVEVYMQTLEQFKSSQLDRQKASLTSNAGRESATVSQKIVRQHQSALQTAMAHAAMMTTPSANGRSRQSSALTLETLQQWHGILTHDLQNDAGLLRSKNVKVGQTSFAEPTAVPLRLQSLMQSFQELEQRFLFLHPGTRPVHYHPDAKERALAAILFASIVFFGIVDVHGFSDGNGRLARIATNWALAKAGFPFCISFHATPTQRTEYSRAIRKTRRNIDTVPIVLTSDPPATYNPISDDQYLFALKQFGVFLPIVDLLMDRVFKTIAEFQKSLEEATALHTEASHALAARLFRERAAQNSCCLICLDNQPNIATLCCGKAVHLNCMAEWLASNNSCPNCRANLPSISARVLQKANNSNNDEDNEEWTTTISDDDSHDNNDTNVDADDTTTSDADDTETATVTVVVAPTNNSSDEDDTTTDDTMTEENSSTVPTAMNEDHDTTANEDETTDDTSTTTVQQQSSSRIQAPVCRTCRNRAAIDCCNHMCGRCCVLEGRFRCSRHSS